MRERTDYVNYTEGIGITYHGFEPEDEPERIDYIYIKKSKRRLCRTYLPQCKKMGRPQQRSMAFPIHYPICAELEWIKSIKNTGHFSECRFFH